MSEGMTLYCGDNCNHTGPHRYPPSKTDFAAPYRCPHGLDLRMVPRCYLCQPVVGCQCPLYWFGVVPPPCPVHNPPRPYYPTVTTNTTTLRCDCPESGTSGTCSLHDNVTYTGWSA